MKFGSGPEDVYLLPDEDGDLQQAVGVVVRCYPTETGGTAITDLLDVNSQAITYVTTSTGSDGRAPGQIPPFYGPDATFELWAGADGQPRFLLQASNLGSVLGPVREQYLAHAGEANAHGTKLRDLTDVDSVSVAAAGAGQALIYDTGSGQWEAGPVAVAAPAASILWVAAVDAPAQFANAPYKCDGIADQTEINAALSNALGLRVGLSPGTFTISAPIQLLGADDSTIEVSRYLQGSGTYATTIVVGSAVAHGIFLGQSVSPHVSDLTVQVSSASHGIVATKSSTPAASARSFWHGSLKNLQIIGPWNSTHTGWGLKLGSGFRYVVENVEITGTLNGIQVLNEDSSVNCGDAVFLRCFVEIIGNNGTAYHVSSPTGEARHILFNTCHGSAQAANTGTTCWKFDGAGANSHIRVLNSGAKQFLTTISLSSSSYDVDLDLGHVTQRNGSTFADLDGWNSRIKAGQIYVETSATVTLIDDDNTNTAKPNVLGPMDVIADTGSNVSVELVDTVVLNQVTFDGAGTVNAAVRKPPGVIASRAFGMIDAATITIDAQRSSWHRVTLAGNRTMAAPTTPSDGQRLIVEVIQDATGSRTLTWNAAFTFGTITNTLTTTAGRRDVFEFIYQSSIGKWLVLNASKNLV